MASYEEDHGISSRSSRTSNTNNDEGHEQNHRVLLSQQPNLSSFFNMDREDTNQSSRMSSFLNSSGLSGGAAADPASRDSYTRALLGALSQYSDESDVARDLVNQLEQELESNNDNTQTRSNNTNNTEHQAALFQNIMAAANASSFAQDLVLGENGSLSKKPSGVSQQFLDGLDRVSKKKLKRDDKCPICATAFLEDEYPLVVELPCSTLHRFDLDCIAPWLTLHADCPLCRKDLLAKKIVEPVPDEEEEEEFDDFYG